MPNPFICLSAVKISNVKKAHILSVLYKIKYIFFHLIHTVHNHNAQSDSQCLFAVCDALFPALKWPLMGN